MFDALTYVGAPSVGSIVTGYVAPASSIIIDTTPASAMKRDGSTRPLASHALRPANVSRTTPSASEKLRLRPSSVTPTFRP